MNSITFAASRQYPGRLNVARYEARQRILLPGILEPLLYTGTNDLTKNENQSTQLKDVRLSVFLPTCSPDGIEIPDQRVTPVVGVYHTYTFFINMNGGRWEIPVVYTNNCEVMISRQWLADFPSVTQSIEVFVRRDFIEPDWNLAPVTLAAILEFSVFANQ